MTELPNKFWIVTIPTPRSTLGDICHESDLHGLRLQFLGGLTAQMIYGIYLDETTARHTANRLLAERIAP